MLNGEVLNENILVGEIQREVIDLRKEEQHKTVKPTSHDILVEPDTPMQTLGSVLVKGVALDKPDQDKSVMPSVEEQVVMADDGYELASVTVGGVTSEIDSNIQAENIRHGVEILGVVGSMEQIDLSATTATEEDVVAGKQFYNAQGELKTGAFKDMLQARIDENNNCDYLFYKCGNSTINYIKNLDTSRVTSMKYMFNYCEATSEIDVSGFDTSNVTTMFYMFSSCSNLKEIDISNFNMDKLSQCDYMFASCKNLEKFVANETHSTTLTNLPSMFYYCQSLRNIDLSKWYITPTNIGSMFDYCMSTESIDISNFDTSNTTTMTQMCRYCKSLTNIKVGDKFDTSKVQKFNYMFTDCRELESLPTMNVVSGTSFSSFVDGCVKLKNINILNIKTSLYLGNGTYWGTMLTNESLINTFKELWDLTGSTSQTLRLSTTSKENIANVYVKLIDVTDEMLASDPYASNKKPCVVCDASDEGAMTLTEYAISKNWAIG